jgi:hypothetical protein
MRHGARRATVDKREQECSEQRGDFELPAAPQDRP